MKISDKQYLVSESDFFEPRNNETCFCVSNGYFAVRGSSDELWDSEYPGCFVSGVFDKGSAPVTELVNLPYPLGLRLYVDREHFDFRHCRIESHERVLDMKQSLLYRCTRATDTKGRTLRFESTRLASVASRNLGYANYRIVCENFSGVVNVESFIDTNVYNAKHNPNDRIRHFTATNQNAEDFLYTACQTLDQAYTVAIASKLVVDSLENATCLGGYLRDLGCVNFQSYEFEVSPGAELALSRFVSLVSSREGANVRARTHYAVSTAAHGGGELLMKAHIHGFAKLWENCDIQIQGDEQADRALRFCNYLLICCVNPEDEHASIGAKGIHGEGYKGHVFWDTEVFMLPFYIYTLPRYAHALLMYRYHGLNGARQNARLGGYDGARYPWESADAGLEETPAWGFDYKGQRVRIWTGDIELHITSDIVYAIREYLRASGDTAFWESHGAEIIFETARFWVSRLEYNAERDRYEISDVIGPDEFHEHVNNSAYTNSLAKWNIDFAIQCADKLANENPQIWRKLCSKIGFDLAEANAWKPISQRVFIPMDGGLIEQFQGYFDLEDRVVEGLDENQMPIWPENVDISKLNAYTLIKQADVLMLMHMLPEQFTLDTMIDNYLYYEKRTMHKSSLSPGMYALMGAKTRQYDKAYEHFMRTAHTDLSDNQGNGALGIHAAAAGGAWCAVFYGFCGIEMDKSDILHVNPWIPPQWQAIKIRFVYQGRLIALTVTQDDVLLSRISGEPLEVCLQGKRRCI